MAASIDSQIVRSLRAEGVNFGAYVPCALLAGAVEELSRGPAPLVEVTREEEGVGVCAGAALAGALPVLLLQNSGLGNCGNALTSLTRFYRLPLLLVVGYRGGAHEPIAAQRPMGAATEGLLSALSVPFEIVDRAGALARLGRAARRARRESGPSAVLLRPQVWR